MRKYARVLWGATIALGVAAPCTGQQLLSGVRGGMKYDNWWTARGLPAPQGNHPLYPGAGQQSGAATWRCAECHGWDYKGAAGAYGAGEHYTGIRGVLGSTMTRQQMFNLLKFNHGYQASGLTDADYYDLVEFLQTYLVDPAPYIDANGDFVGDATNGRFNYQAANNAYTCASCHGEQSAALAQVATDDPYRFLHQVRFSDPDGVMTSWLLAGQTTQGVADIGAYLAAGQPGPVYAGDQACITCHADSPSPGFFERYRQSGHPWKILRTAGEIPAADTWPHSPVPPLPTVNGTQLQWSDVEYVIGNFKWKTRFIDRNGYIYTGSATDRTQWNLATGRWVGYSAGVVNKPFDCGTCHTTGYSPQGHQHGLPGLIGTWAQDGVRCEACHGPSSDHVAHPAQMDTPGGMDCADCHYRDPQFRMPWKSGFMEHHQQSEDLYHSPHEGILSCATCHDPHRSTVYADDAIRRQCTDCHTGDAANNHYVVAGMESVACIDCHMPRMGKSAEAPNASMGDIRGHIFRIMTAPTTAAQNVYQAGTPFWRQNAWGRSYVTLDYACLGCHTQIGEPLTMMEASAYAYRIHTRLPGDLPCDPDANCDGAVNGFDVQAVEEAVNGDFSNFCLPDADINADGSVNGFDIETQEQRVNGAPC